MPFFLLKGLSFLPFGGIFKNPKVLLAIILIAVVAFGIWKWKRSIQEAAYNAIYTEQAEQHLENQRKEQERVQALISEGNRAVAEAQRRREKLLSEIESARSATRNVDPSQNGEVAPVLSEALEWIRSRQDLTRAPVEPTLGDRAKSVIDSGVEKSDGLLKRGKEAAHDTIESGNSAIDAWKRKLGVE